MNLKNEIRNEIRLWKWKEYTCMICKIHTFPYEATNQLWSPQRVLAMQVSVSATENSKIASYVRYSESSLVGLMHLIYDTTIMEGEGSCIIIWNYLWINVPFQMFFICSPITSSRWSHYPWPFYPWPGVWSICPLPRHHCSLRLWSVKPGSFRHRAHQSFFLIFVNMKWDHYKDKKLQGSIFENILITHS